MNFATLLVYGGFFALLAVLIVRGMRNARRFSRARALLAQINTQEPLAVGLQSDGLPFWSVLIGVAPAGSARAWLARTVTLSLPQAKLSPTSTPQASTRRRAFVIAVHADRLVFYPLDALAVPQVFPLDRLRWFGRPKKYHYGKNEMWLHFEMDGGWQVIRLELHRTTMQLFVRTLKEVAAPELVTAYRRRRPYVHFGPAAAQPAKQDVLGAWALGGPVSLYLMPLHLVVMHGAAVQRAIALDTVQAISAIRRLDQPQAAGLVRFEADGEALAFALDAYEVFAAALADAAKRTLEDPIQWQRKKKKPGGLGILADLDDDEDD